MISWARRELKKILHAQHGDFQLQMVFISSALETIGWSIRSPGRPTLHQTLSLSSTSVGHISALISMIALASVVIQGMASDAMGRVKLLSISSIAQLIGHVVLYGIAKGYISSIWIFVAFRVLPSIFKCGMIVSQAYVCDWIYSHPVDVDSGVEGLNAQQIATKHISTLMAYTNVGFIVGPILGGQLSAMDPAYPFSAGCAVFLLNLALLSQMTDPPREGQSLSKSNSTTNFDSTDDDPENGQNGYSSRRSIQLKSSIRPRLKYLPLATHDSEFRPYLSNSLSLAGMQQQQQQTRSESYGGGGYQGGVGSGNGNGNGYSHGNNSLSNRGTPPTSSRYESTRTTQAQPREQHLPSLIWLLHVKFAFQIGNAIYESLFGQHLKDRLGTSSQDLGWLLGFVGLEAAMVNGVLVRFVLAVPSRMWPALIVSSLIQGAGLWLWALCASFNSAAMGAALISLSSNTFLSILQGLIARHSDSGSASSSSSKGGAGRTFGLSTSIDRAARTVAPIIGGVSLQMFGLSGFAAVAGSTGIYSAGALTIWSGLYGQRTSRFSNKSDRLHTE